MKETPAPGALDLVGPLQQHGQQSHQGSQQPGEPQQPPNEAGGQHRGVEDGLGDADEALHSHGARQEQGAQAEEDHTRPKDAAHDAMRVKGLPLPLEVVDVKHQGAVDEVTQQVCDHQAAGKQQEEGPGLDSKALVGFEQDEEGGTVGADAHSHGDD